MNKKLTLLFLAIVSTTSICGINGSSNNGLEQTCNCSPRMWTPKYKFSALLLYLMAQKRTDSPIYKVVGEIVFMILCTDILFNLEEGIPKVYHEIKNYRQRQNKRGALNATAHLLLALTIQMTALAHIYGDN